TESWARAAMLSTRPATAKISFRFILLSKYRRVFIRSAAKIQSNSAVEQGCVGAASRVTKRGESVSSVLADTRLSFWHSSFVFVLANCIIDAPASFAIQFITCMKPGKFLKYFILLVIAANLVIVAMV